VLMEACTDMGSNVLIISSSPVITSIQPDSAASGDTITIHGKNFGASRSSSRVLFGSGISATVFITWTSSAIQVKVPDSAATGNVFVSVNGVSSNGFQFKTPIVGLIVSFKGQIQPILTSNCTSCHGGSFAASGFNQTTYAGVIAGGNEFHSNDVIPHDSTNSKIIQKLRGKAGAQMPLDRVPLPDSLIVRIGTWIEQGALNN